MQLIIQIYWRGDENICCGYCQICKTYSSSSVENPVSRKKSTCLPVSFIIKINDKKQKWEIKLNTIWEAQLDIQRKWNVKARGVVKGKKRNMIIVYNLHFAICMYICMYIEESILQFFKQIHILKNSYFLKHEIISKGYTQMSSVVE